ncbi:MAG: substrate-binding domain-containing protein, partial [Prolixibacteraceae bacterium]|nr:substrate-binding domain-containing protein [Prolixibacteraceae bacterium]
CFVTDNYNSAYHATMHLIEQGCKNLVHLTQNSSINIYSDRKKGFEAAVNASGVKGRTVFLKNLNIDCGQQIAEVILESSKLPDGIFASNDTTAIGCMKTLLRRGIKIPEQICIVGFNNDPSSSLVSPMLSSIDYPGKIAGAKAANYLIGLLEGKAFCSDEKYFTIESKLVIRESSNRNGIINKK